MKRARLCDRILAKDEAALRRRDFLTVTAVTGPIAAASRVYLKRVNTRETGKVEIVFDSPGLNPKPNGLQATDQGLWIIDQVCYVKTP